MNGSQVPDGAVILTEEERKTLVETESYEQGTAVAQIFSGIFFTGVTAWLSLSNGTSLAFVQRAALEKRLTTCCFLNVYVGAFSSFFNYFQLTQVDDLVIPDSDNFTLDLARPLEWIMTCPLMQLSLVLMGGAKLPEHRRYLMPGFSVVILLMGTFGAFLGANILAVKAIFWTVGCALFGVMVYFNRLQIIEYSNGQEGLISGDSEFRKATILLIATWSPFPIWYVVSPEGLTLLENPLIIQVGWAFLNIVAKFSFIFYTQRVKDMYCNRLKTKREMQPAKAMHGAAGGHAGFRSGHMSPHLEGDFSGVVGGYTTAAELEVEDLAKKRAQLSAVVVETMNFLGMAQHTERFLNLLDSAQMHSILEVEALTKERCTEIQLPYDLVSALQRRLRVWKLEMVDDAETGLDKGEEFYIRKGADGSRGMSEDAGMLVPGMYPMFDPEEQNAKLEKIEELLREKLEGQDTVLYESRSTSELVDRSLQGIVAQFQAAMEAMEVRLLDRLAAPGGPPAEATARDAASQRSEVRAFEMRITAKLEELRTFAEKQRRHELNTLEGRISANAEQQASVLAAKLDTCYQKIEGCGHKADLCCQKVETCHAAQMAHAVESVSRSTEKFEEVFRLTGSMSDALSKSVDAGLAKLGSQSSAILESIESLSTQTRTGLELLSQKADSLQSSQTKTAATAEEGLHQRFSDLESSMVCRDHEQEATAKRRFEELLRAAPTRKVDELASQLSKLGERVDRSSETLASSLTSEIQSASGRGTLKTDNAQSALARLIAEQATASLRRSEELSKSAQASSQLLVQRVDALDAALARRLDASLEASTASASGLGAALSKQLQELVQVTQTSTEKAAKSTATLIDSVNSELLRRIDDSIQKSAAEAAHSGASAAERRAEKAVEALEGSHRSELSAATAQLLERFDDLSASQARKTTEREERTLRRIEELLELTATRTTQKTEDVGLDVKKELHGFAKRLNSKIPFM